MACAGYHFARLAGFIGRCARTVLQTCPFFQFLLADDLKFLGGAPRGVRISGPFRISGAWWAPPLRGVSSTAVQLDYVGFAFDYLRFTLGLLEQRARWIIDYVNAAQGGQGLLDHRRFMEFVGRLVCVSQPSLEGSSDTWHRGGGPADGYAHSGMHPGLLQEGRTQITCRRPPALGPDACRTDGLQGSEDDCILDTSDPGLARWFSLKISSHEFPALLNERGEAERARVLLRSCSPPW